MGGTGSIPRRAQEVLEAHFAFCENDFCRCQALGGLFIGLDATRGSRTRRSMLLTIKGRMVCFLRYGQSRHSGQPWMLFCVSPPNTRQGSSELSQTRGGYLIRFSLLVRRL